MNAQNLRQRWRKRVEKIGGNSGGRETINFEIPLRIFGGGNHVERVQRTWDERVFNHRAYNGEARVHVFNRLKYAPAFFFFQLLFTSAARFRRAVRAIRRFMAQRGALIETIAINNSQYKLGKTST